VSPIAQQTQSTQPAEQINQNLSASELNNPPVKHHQIVIVDGGAAGITVAAQLLKRNRALDIAIIEPSDKHYYQSG
jgi:sulfide:quinone oxidoreductase